MYCRFVRRINSSRPWDKEGARFKKKFFRPFGPQFGLGGLKIFSYPSGMASPLCLKELCHEIYQNSNQGNCHRTEWNIKITAQKVRRKYKWQSKYKRKHGWTNFRKIETQCNFGFWKLGSLTFFQKSFLWFVAIDILLERQIFSTKSCNLSFSGNFSSFIAELWRAKRACGAPWARKCGKLPIQEDLVITWPYARPSVRTTGMWNNSINRYGNPNATRGYLGGKSHSHPRL